jgi:hypothetical protein
MFREEEYNEEFNIEEESGDVSNDDESDYPYYWIDSDIADPEYIPGKFFDEDLPWN